MDNYVLTLGESLSFLDGKVFSSRDAALLEAFAWAEKLETDISVRTFSDSGQLGPAQDIVEG